MDQQERAFRGVWFPAEVWLDKRLSALEKMVLLEIDSLDGEDGCYASNQYLAEFCQCSESKVSKAIAKLKSLGYVVVASFDGRRRILHSCLSENAEQGSKKCYPDEQKVPERVLGKSAREEKKERSGAKPSVSRETYDSIIDGYTDDEGVRDALREFVKMRKLIKRPMTNRALTNLLSRLTRLSGEPEVQVALLDQSITHGWQTVYPLKDDIPRQQEDVVMTEFGAVSRKDYETYMSYGY